jgi:hypothetical protein
VLQSCCVFDCSSDYAGQSFFLDFMNQGSASWTCDHATILCCGDYSSQQSGLAVYGYLGRSFSYFNFTSCRVEDIASAIDFSDLNGGGIFDHSLIHFCAGGSLVRHLPATAGKLELCCFYNDTIDSSGAIVTSGVGVSCESCIFLFSDPVYAASGTEQTWFRKCWFSGAAPAGGSKDGCETNTLTPTYGFAGYVNEVCPTLPFRSETIAVVVYSGSRMFTMSRLEVQRTAVIHPSSSMTPSAAATHDPAPRKLRWNVRSRQCGGEGEPA